MPDTLWRGPDRLVLASGSMTRFKLLASTGIGVEVVAPNIDERGLEAQAAASGAGAVEIARRLASEKALAGSRLRPGRVVLGADQTLEVEGELLHKPPDLEAARVQIARLSGRTHALHAGFALVQDGAVVHADVASARLTMRVLGPEAIDHYLRLAGEAATGSVGAYQVEGVGIHLFERIEGEHSVILGLPLLPLLAALRSMQLLAL
jgi:septum formation protein